MGILGFIKQIDKSGLLEKQSKENNLIVKPAFDQILNNLESVPNSNDNTDYYWITTEMKNHLNYKEVELLVDLTENFSNRDAFLSALEKEKYFWRNKIEFEYFKDIENAKLSLCTSDYLAFIIGKKYDLYLLMDKISFWNQTYKSLDSELNLIILQENLLCSLEGNQKAHVPVNYALSMFLLHNRDEALAKFKRILSSDRAHRLEVSHQAEYFLTVDKFFSRIKLNFIPQINHTNQSDPINFENTNDQYITREEIKILIDKEDLFNKREFCVDIKKLLTPRNITNRELIVESYFMFFKSLDSTLKRKNIEILISCFTETNPGYEEIKIRNARFILNDLLAEQKQHTNFIVLNYYLFYYKNEFSTARNNLAFLLSEFFNKVSGMGIESIKAVFYRNVIDCDAALSKNLRDFIEKHPL